MRKVLRWKPIKLFGNRFVLTAHLCELRRLFFNFRKNSCVMASSYNVACGDLPDAIRIHCAMSPVSIAQASPQPATYAFSTSCSYPPTPRAQLGAISFRNSLVSFCHRSSSYFGPEPRSCSCPRKEQQRFNIVIRQVRAPWLQEPIASQGFN